MIAALLPALFDEVPSPAAESASPCFHRTRVIGYSQVGATRGGWFVQDGVFESIVGNDRWELLWQGGAGVDQWRKPDYPGWSRPLASPCPGNSPPDRVVLSISGPYGSDATAWADAIEGTIRNIREKIPSARQIVLQPVVGGPGGQSCPAPPDGTSQRKGEGRVRASWQHAHILNAIRKVVKQHATDDPVRVVAGCEPTVRTCDDYADALGHLKPGAAKAVAGTVGDYYRQRDAACAESGHKHCGKQAGSPRPK
jgi:hypothetical protein